jgi:hypothetical protein
MTAPELKPCPFCGGTDSLMVSRLFLDTWSVWCLEHQDGPTGQGEQAAVGAWNTRAGGVSE